MDTGKSTSSNDERALAQAMQELASTIREAGECLLDLQQAVDTLRLANDPTLARVVDRETAACMRAAMRRD
ncbi:MAG TPA: hypothetical protein VJ743_09270 [Albitalea sp.]|nr:hypothetical protein [Albitalea sp.]